MKIQRYDYFEGYGHTKDDNGEWCKYENHVKDKAEAIAKLEEEKLELIQEQREQANKYIDMKDKLEAEKDKLRTALDIIIQDSLEEKIVRIAEQALEE